MFHCFVITLFQRVARNARRRKSDHFANIQLVETNAVSAAMFLVMRRKIEIYISRFLFLLQFPPPSNPYLSQAHRINNYFFFITVSDEEWKRENGNKIFYSLLKCSCDNIFCSRLLFAAARTEARKIKKLAIYVIQSANCSRIYLTTEAKYEEHNEEQDSPEIRPAHPHHRLRVGDKSQSLCILDHLADRQMHLLG